jgi:hypothetical protein
MSATLEQKNTAKAQAIKRVHKLSEISSKDKSMYQTYVRQKIESGLSQIKTGNVHMHHTICKEFNIRNIDGSIKVISSGKLEAAKNTRSLIIIRPPATEGSTKVRTQVIMDRPVVIVPAK